jgi:hypothetical protein
MGEYAQNSIFHITNNNNTWTLKTFYTIGKTFIGLQTIFHINGDIMKIKIQDTSIVYTNYHQAIVQYNYIQLYNTRSVDFCLTLCNLFYK